MTLPRMPLTEAQYFPDPSEPVDRWFQADNASNPRTTADLIMSISRDKPRLIIDPFCGSGSTASAARLLGLPFYGIEADPVLVCTSVAKAWGHVRHAALLPASPDAHTPAGLAPALEHIRRSCDPEDARVASAMTVLAAFRSTRNERLETAEIAGDLAAWPGPVPAGQIVRGDALRTASWQRLSLPCTDAIMYTSPPFGLSSPAIHPPEYVTAAARAVLAASNADLLEGEVPPFRGYASTAVGMLRQSAAYLTCGTLIMEHEPDDLGMDSTVAVVDAVAAEFPGVIHSPRIMRCGAFSRRGMLSLIICDLR
jgi:hypothetical protein